MKFDVRVREADGKETVWEWGTNSCMVTDANGVRRNPKKENWVPIEDKTSKMFELTSIDIMLGYNCNLNCKYCYQREDRKKYKGVTATVDKVYGFVEMLKDVGADLKNVYLFGGEPLVFFKTLEVLVPKLQEYWPKAKVTMVTNGTLLSKSVVNWCVERGMYVGISCDLTPEDRGVDVLALKKADLLYAKEKLGNKLWFQGVSSKGNEDFGALLNRVQSAVGKVYVSDPMPLRYMKPEDVASCAGDVDNKLVEESYYKVLTETDRYSSNLIRTIGIIKNRVPTVKNSGHCFYCRGFGVCTDLAGNIFPCHSDCTQIIGHLKEWQKLPLNRYWSPAERGKCLECPVLPICQGNCALLHPDTFDASCKNIYAVSRAKLRAAWKKLFDVEILEITPKKE